MKRPKILVAGSFVMDQIATTTIFPNEGETVLGKSFQKAPGGKGANQAVQASRLGASVSMFGKLGRDANGEEMLRVCQESGVDTSFVQNDNAAASGCAVIVLEDDGTGTAKNRIIVIPGSNMNISPEEAASIRSAIARYDMLLLQLEIPMQINCLLAEYAAQSNVPVMLNPAPSAPLPDSLLRNITFLSPNEHEAAELSGVPIRREDGKINISDAMLAAQRLQSKGVKNVLITMGDEGALLLHEDGYIRNPCVSNICAVDPTAAGDSFVSSFCCGICCGWSNEDALKFAGYTAALTVSSMGAMPSLPTLTQVKELMEQRSESVPNTTPLGDN